MPYHSHKLVRKQDTLRKAPTKYGQIRDLKESLEVLDPDKSSQLRKTICKRILQLQSQLRQISTPIPTSQCEDQARSKQ